MAQGKQHQKQQQGSKQKNPAKSEKKAKKPSDKPRQQQNEQKAHQRRSVIDVQTDDAVVSMFTPVMPDATLATRWMTAPEFRSGVPVRPAAMPASNEERSRILAAVVSGETAYKGAEEYYHTMQATYMVDVPILGVAAGTDTTHILTRVELGGRVRILAVTARDLSSVAVHGWREVSGLDKPTLELLVSTKDAPTGATPLEVQAFETFAPCPAVLQLQPTDGAKVTPEMGTTRPAIRECNPVHLIREARKGHAKSIALMARACGRSVARRMPDVNMPGARLRSDGCYSANVHLCRVMMAAILIQEGAKCVGGMTGTAAMMPIW